MLLSAIASLALLALPTFTEARLTSRHNTISKRSAVTRRSKCKPVDSEPNNATVTPGSSAPGSSGGRVKAAWYAGWSADTFPVSSVTWEKYNHMTYAFAVTTNDGSYFTLQPSDEALLPQFVTAAHAKNVKALLSIGGWTGSLYFSPLVATDSSRKGFIKAISAVVKKYKLDGIDFDWEYPTLQGIGCNQFSKDDTANYLKFLQQLRADPVGKNLILTAATYIKPFNDADGNPSSDVSGFAKVLTYIAIMNYDIWGAWATPAVVGPNAPLDDSCAGAGRQVGSATSAVKAWNDAGIPKNQIVLGVASYGHSFKVKKSDAYSSGTTLSSYPAFDASVYPTGDAADVGPYTASECGTPTYPSGEFTFHGLIDSGWLNKDGKVASGYQYRFDQCSKTAYIYSPEKEQMVSYDDVSSWAAKGSFIKSKDLGGFASWEASGDSGTMLIDAISDAM